jgi:hypothetical protein
MAGKFKLNSGEFAGLNQLSGACPSGKSWDFLVKQVAGTVTMTLPGEEADAIEVRKWESISKKYTTET